MHFLKYDDPKDPLTPAEDLGFLALLGGFVSLFFWKPGLGIGIAIYGVSIVLSKRYRINSRLWDVVVVGPEAQLLGWLVTIAGVVFFAMSFAHDQFG